MNEKKKKVALVIGAGSIFPEFEWPIRLFDTDQIPYVIEQGEKAMLEQLPYVKRLLELS